MSNKFWSKRCKRKIIAKAYKEAEPQAQPIALAAGKNLKQCVKVDFKPFTSEYVSQSNLDTNMMYAKDAKFGAAAIIINTFTPEDIEISGVIKKGMWLFTSFLVVFYLIKNFYFNIDLE